MKKKDPNAEAEIIGIDLFAGAGGFTLAAKKAGIRIKAAVELNSHACKTYRRNLITGKKKAPKLFENDINLIEVDDFLKKSKIEPGECDILIGGPPCQGFSTHRINNAGVDDPRNSLLLRYFWFLNKIKPKIFVVENVPGLMWKRHEKYLAEFIKEAEVAGYKIKPPRILNAKDYGVPQNRKRVFIVGIRNGLDLDIEWPPKPTHYHPASKEVVKENRPKWLNAGVAFNIPFLVNDINAIHMNHSAKMVDVFMRTPLNGGSRAESGRTLPCHDKHDGHKDVYGRIDPSKPSPTMTTACINPSRGRFVHPTLHHGITARHAARLQTFPDSFIFEGGLTAAGVQIGNAVPINLGIAVLSSLTSALGNKK